VMADAIRGLATAPPPSRSAPEGLLDGHDVIADRAHMLETRWSQAGE